MNSPGNSNFHTLENLKQWRLAGDLGPALQGATQALGGSSVDPAVLAECIRILILAESTDLAVKLYTLLTDNPHQDNNLEPEALVRLALQMGRTDLLQGMPVPDEPRWLDALLTGGEEPIKSPAWSRLKVEVANGPSVYFLTGRCPYCSHQLRKRIPTSLLIDQQALCPACFGQVRVNWLDIKKFIQEEHSGLLNCDVRESDWDLIAHVRTRLMEKKGAPGIVLALGQEYHFLLNEILARHLMQDQSPEGGDLP